MIKKIVSIFAIFMILVLTLNVKTEIRYLGEEDDTIEWNNYEVVQYS